jgi:RHS repeat-associated protein
MKTVFAFTLAATLLGSLSAHARAYAPDKGRFWTADEFEGAPTQPDTLNRYAYTSNDPINKSDPSGYCSDPAPSSPFKRLCIDAFIPTKYAAGAVFLGDDRGPDPAHGTFRTEQRIWNIGGPMQWQTIPGVSVLNYLGVSHPGHIAWSTIQPCGNECVEASIGASDGLLFGAAPNLAYDLKFATFNLLQGAIGWRKNYPSIEAWLYSASEQPRLIYFYDASSSGELDIYGVSYVSFGDGVSGITATTLMPKIFSGDYSGGSGTSVPTPGGF